MCNMSLLEQASLLDEDEVVIEFSIDRFQHFISVRIVLFLAIAAKVTEVLNGNISCYPASNETKTDRYFKNFADTFCWESPYISEGTSDLSGKMTQCTSASSKELVLDKPEAATTTLRWLPYGLLFEALLYALPSAWWHFRVGARLTGHLKFVKLFIKEAVDCLKEVPCGVPDEEPYDHTSAQLDGRVKFDKERKMRSVSKDIQDNNDTKRKKMFDKTVSYCKNDAESKNDKRADAIACGSEDGLNIASSSFINRITVLPGPGKGKMLDRHFFSMLCFENFARLHNFPYFRSIVRATFFAHFEDDEELFPLNEGILRQWCHEDNFSGRFLVVRYYCKHILVILMSVGLLRLAAFIFELLGREIWYTDSFRCQVDFFEGWDVLCAMHRRAQMLAFLLLNVVVIITTLIISIWQLRLVSGNREKESSCFFENIDVCGSVGMRAALQLRQDKQRRKTKT